MESVGATVFNPIFGSVSPDSPTTQPPPKRSRADYVGTWNGTFGAPPNPNQSWNLQSGTLTLTFSASGGVTGQISDSTTGQSGTITGTLTVSGDATADHMDLTFMLNGQPVKTTNNPIVDTSGVLHGDVFLPTEPGHADTTQIEYTLNKS